MHTTVTQSDHGDALHYSNVSAPGVLVNGTHGVKLDTSLTPALAGTIDALPDITGQGPDGGYLSLALSRHRAGRRCRRRHDHELHRAAVLLRR